MRSGAGRFNVPQWWETRTMCFKPLEYGAENVSKITELGRGPLWTAVNYPIAVM